MLGTVEVNRLLQVRKVVRGQPVWSLEVPMAMVVENLVVPTEVYAAVGLQVVVP